MSDVKCNSRKCRGALHDPTCDVYKAAMLAFDARKRGTDLERRRERFARNDAKRADKSHKKKPPEQLLTLEQRREIAKATGGRPPGTKNALPQGFVKALELVRRLQAEGYMTKAESTEAEKDLVNLSTEELIKIMVSGGRPKTLPSRLKAIIRIREEVARPVVTETKNTVDLNMSNQVRAAQKLVQERKAAREGNVARKAGKENT